MIGLCLVSIITFADAASVLFKDEPFLIHPCNEGVTIKNKCNTCVCSQSHVYECTPEYSNDCKDDFRSDASCHPNVMYVLNDTVCICNSSGQWPHEQCKNTFRSLEPHKTGIDCKPNSYITYDCNVCRCGPDGKIDENHCTKNKCQITKDKKHFVKSRRISNSVYGNCEVKNWYSLAPCQFCFCVNENKLVCNTGNSYSHKLELGAYNLSVCGKELIREAIELIPEHQNNLRYGIDNITANEAIPTVTAVHDNHVAINVNREGDEQKLFMNHGHDDEYYTDSDEEKPSVKGFEPPSKLNNNEISNRLTFPTSDVRKESEELETDNEMGVEIEAEIPKQVQNVVKQDVPASNQNLAHAFPENFNLGEALKLNLPMVLDKVFQMALRKSMVSVNSESKCTTGAATILKCNVCFCMKENKLLCTNNVCE